MVTVMCVRYLRFWRGIFLHETGPFIFESEAAIGPGRKLEEMCRMICRYRVDIRDELIGGVGFLADIFRVMQLPEIQNPR